MEKVGIEYVFDVSQAVANAAKLNKGFAEVDKNVQNSSKNLNNFERKLSGIKRIATKFNPGKGLGDIQPQASKLNNSLKSINTNQMNLNKSMKSGGMGAMAVAKGMMIFSAAMGVLKAGFGALMQNMPFLGHTFSMVGKIIGANLLHPLAREVLPLIMKLFKWVRENRIVFVKLGTILVSVFRLVKTVIVSVFNSVRTLFKSFLDTIGIGSKLTMNKFIMFVNFILLKIAFIFTFVSLMLEPVFSKLGKVAGFLWNNILFPYIKGFLSGFKNIIGASGGLSRIIEKLGQIFEKLGFSSKKNINWLQKGFQGIGWIIGNMVIGPTRILIWLIEKGLDAIIYLIDKFKYLSIQASNTYNSIAAGAAKLISYFKNLWSEIKGKVKSFFTSIFDGSLAARISKWLINGFRAGWEYVKNTPLGKFISGSIQGLKEGGTRVFNYVKNVIPSKKALQNIIPGRASGGPVRKGQPYIVGEKRPELFVPEERGTILPSVSTAKTESRQSVQDNRQFHFNISGADPKQIAQEVKRVVEQLQLPFRQPMINSNLRFT